MSVPPAFKRPQSLPLLISTSPTLRGLAANTPSPLSTPPPSGPWGYETPSGECYERICSVVCLYDFSSSDSDHLSFRKDEILAILQQKESGWWGAVRSDGSEAGWIPASYVHTLSDDAAERVHNVGGKLLSPENGAEQDSIGSASPFARRLDETPSSSDTTLCNEPSGTTKVRSTFLTGCI
jgi:son of sevenless